MAKDRYSEATQENGQLEGRLEASQATLLAAKEEANTAQAWLAESNAMVAGKMNPRNAFILIPLYYIDSPPISVIASPNGAVGVSSTSSECGRRCHQRLGPPHHCLPP